MPSNPTGPDHIYLLTDAAEKARIRRILPERRLASHMNDTKWRELCRGVRTLPFPPAYQVKYVDSDALVPVALEHAPSYFGDWARTPEASLGMHIELLKIAPRYRSSGRLSGPQVEDCSTELVALLDQLRLLYVKQDDFIILYGHR